MSTLDGWVQFMAATGATRATIQTRTATIRALLRHAQVNDPRFLTRDHVIAFLARDIKPWTRLTYWKAIRKWCDYLADFGAGDPGLLRGLPQPRTPSPIARPIDDETIARLLALPLTSRPHAYIRLALFAGLRVHEIAKIRGEDFDHSAGWLTVTGKGGYAAVVPIHPVVSELAATRTEIGYWFPARFDVSQPVHPIAVGQTIAAALRRVGSSATAHQLRDTAATRIQRQVHDLRVTQSMLRHRSIRSTVKYTQVADESMRAAVAALSWAA